MKSFEILTSLEEAEQFIQQHKLAFLYISRADCSVCHALLPRIQSIMTQYTEIALAHIDAQEVQEVAGRFSVFTVPVLLLFIEGREYVREARIVSTDLFDDKIRKIYELVQE